MKADDPNTDWQRCFQELAPKLLLYARQWNASAADAEDVVQMAFVRWWQKNPGGNREHVPLLYAAVRSISLDVRKSEVRRAKRELASDLSMPEGDKPYFDPPVEDRENRQLLERAVLSLPADQREVVAPGNIHRDRAGGSVEALDGQRIDDRLPRAQGRAGEGTRHG